MNAASDTSPKQILATHAAPERHWVGDGFPVHGLFDYGPGADTRSPFLMLDYAAPTRFEPTSQRRGVGTHPHRGFETVTIVYAGEVEHRDSTGQGGVIGPGDVQWMTAGAGILHEEFHSAAYARSGGAFEMVQLWVNLPAQDKSTPPGYQAIVDAQIPARPLADAGDPAAATPAGRVRVIAGRYLDALGPARSFTPMNVWDVRMAAGRRASLAQPEGWTCLLVVLDGRVRLQDQTELGATQWAQLSNSGTELLVEALDEAKLLVLAGQALDEPVVGYGPFVMNRREEIVQAIADFNAGRFGRMA